MTRLQRLLVIAAWCTSLAHAASVPHLDLAVELDPATRAFTATAQLEATHPIRVRLYRTLTVREAKVDGKPIALPAPAPSGDCAIWSLEIPRNGKLSLTYGGTLPALDTRLDHRGVLTISTPMASAAGSFLPAGACWYPASTDDFTYRVTLTLPGTQRGLVAGDLVKEEVPTVAGARYRAVFELKHPAEGIDLMTGPYEVNERLVDRAGAAPLRLRTYFTPALAGLAAGYLEDSARYVAMYSAAIGPYPYGSFSIVASPLPTGFGMPTLTYLGEEVLKLPFVRATSLGHEILHNWWGNGVFPDYATGNWSEGLTTFMADYAYKERESPAAARDMRLGWIRDMAAIPPEAQTALVRFRSRTHGADAAVGYGKSAMVFFMLRELIGAEAFDRGVRAFWTDYKFKTASWQDLQRAFEKSSGRSLRTFFDQWLKRADAPKVSVTAARSTESGGRYRLAVSLEQAAPPYALRIPVEVEAGGRAETHLVDLDGTRSEVTLDLSAKPDAVKLDPEFRVWRLPAADELPPILRAWITAEAPRYAVASTDPKVSEAAAKLARRLFETAAQKQPAATLDRPAAPLLIIGTHAEVSALLSRLKLPARPADLPAAATAYVWTIAGLPRGTPPVAVISARDADALEALMRPLPHYGAQSYLAFDDARAIARGVWQAASPALPVDSRPR